MIHSPDPWRRAERLIALAPEAWRSGTRTVMTVTLPLDYLDDDGAHELTWLVTTAREPDEVTTTAVAGPLTISVRASLAGQYGIRLSLASSAPVAVSLPALGVNFDAALSWFDGPEGYVLVPRKGQAAPVALTLRQGVLLPVGRAYEWPQPHVLGAGERRSLDLRGEVVPIESLATLVPARVRKLLSCESQKEATSLV